MNLEFNATVISIGSLETISDNFKIQNLRVQTLDDQYPQTYEVSFMNDRSKLLENIVEGQTITLKANLRGKAWEKNGKSGVAHNLVGYYISEFKTETSEEVKA